MEQDYHKQAWEQVDADFYLKQKNSLNPVRRWFHRNRYRNILKMVNEEYIEGMAIVDLGCGSCEWNEDKLPVIGIDYNKSMLTQGIEQGNLSKMIIGDIENKNFDDNSVDIVIISEVLEHINNYDSFLTRIHNMLKPNGVLIISVPYDTLFSLWRPLFAIQCFIQWNLLKQEVYKNAIGHVNNFSPEKLKKLLVDDKFKVERMFNSKRFSIFAKARK